MERPGDSRRYDVLGHDVLVLREGDRWRVEVDGEAVPLAFAAAHEAWRAGVAESLRRGLHAAHGPGWPTRSDVPPALADAFDRIFGPGGRGDAR